MLLASLEFYGGVEYCCCLSFFLHHLLMRIAPRRKKEEKHLFCIFLTVEKMRLLLSFFK
jgi:hypothetical protein